MKQKVIRAGRHSLAVIIPSQFTHALGVKAGDIVKVQTHAKSAKVSIHFPGAMQLPLKYEK